MIQSNIAVKRTFAYSRLLNGFKSFFPSKFQYLLLPACCMVGFVGHSQTLNLKEAVKVAMDNYGSIKAKGNYLKASQAGVRQAQVDFLPAISVGAQQAYGTVNGQFGPLIASGGLNAASSGPPFEEQNWHAAFGGLYLANINWDFFTFGRVKEKVRVAEAEQRRNAGDLEQEKFQHQVRVAAVYLNLLAGHRLKLAQQKNVERANALRTVVQARTRNGLNPGVDSSLANAELSSAKIALTNAINYEQEQAAQLAQLIGVPYQEFILDTLFINRIPASLFDSASTNQDQHPLLQFYQRRIELSKEQEKYYDRLKYPVFSLIGVLQARGSGFNYDYNELNPGAYSSKYWTGIKPTRSNYLVGMGVSWNLTNIKRVQQQVLAQEYTSKGLQNEYEQVSQQVKTQLALAEQQMKNAISNYNEAPVQLKAASDAYLQKTVLYRNGLATIVDVTVSLYTLNRAETERDIANNNVWQALLLKAAASGDFGLFLNEF
ncbi:MAG TPA: TolC family protein [Flavitalea sp.]|nr:TolC family protein [Flavitalea sp.]